MINKNVIIRTLSIKYVRITLYCSFLKFFLKKILPKLLSFPSFARKTYLTPSFYPLVKRAELGVKTPALTSATSLAQRSYAKAGFLPQLFPQHSGAMQGRFFQVFLALLGLWQVLTPSFYPLVKRAQLGVKTCQRLRKTYFFQVQVFLVFTLW